MKKGDFPLNKKKQEWKIMIRINETKSRDTLEEHHGNEIHFF